MNNNEEIYKNICRVCLTYKETKNNICLTDNNSEDGLSCYGKAVTTFANISIRKDNNLPCFMCFQCLKLLKQAIRFKFKCENSEKRLLNWIATYKSKGDLESKIEEVIVQTIMFSQYFPEEVPKNTSNSNFQTSDVQITLLLEENDSNDVDITAQDDNEENPPNIKCNDKLDEILNVMENYISEYTNMQTENFKMHRPRKIFHRNSTNQTRKPIKKGSILPHNSLKGRIEQNNSLKMPSAREKFVCKICNKDLANQNTFRYHMQRHNGCNYICEHCGKGFPVYAELQLHQLARHDTGPYLQCKHCSYKAPRHHNLIEHERLHTGERPYTCDKCGLTFRRRAIWRKHMIYHTEKSVQCRHCPRKFFRRSEMEAHANSVHERRYVYLCHKCDTVYAKTATVRRHLTEKHGIPREMQGKITRIDKARGAPLLEQ